MGICVTVKLLAELIQKSHPKDPKHILLLEIFRLMPKYLELGDLGLWDKAFREVHESKFSRTTNDKISEAIDVVFDLANFNLYSGFQTEKTRTQLQLTQKRLATLGISTPGNFDVGGW